MYRLHVDISHCFRRDSTGFSLDARLSRTRSPSTTRDNYAIMLLNHVTRIEKVETQRDARLINIQIQILARFPARPEYYEMEYLPSLDNLRRNKILFVLEFIIESIVYRWKNDFFFLSFRFY